MPTITYEKQPGIHKTRGSVPISGTDHIYRVKGVLWPEDVEAHIRSMFIGTVLHICPGYSQLGDVRMDIDVNVNPDVIADASRIPLPDKSFDTVLADPPYNSKFQWNHDMLSELYRLARKRIIFQHWFVPANKNGEFKKAHIFKLSDLYVIPTIPEKEKENYKLLSYSDGEDEWVVQEDVKSNPFLLDNVVAWNPRTYFGRLQVISVFTKRRVSDKTMSVLRKSTE